MSKKRHHEDSDDDPPKKRARCNGSESDDEANCTQSQILHELDQEDSGEDPENYPAHAPKSGIIEHIRLENFMNHKKLDFPVGPRVNFVVGGNGSGKSALLVAIVIGLGGSAKDAGRADNLGELVRLDSRTHHAIVRIHLRNRGPGAYRFADYGTSITIERKIKREGASTFRFLSKQGNVVATKKAELTLILENFNIDVLNKCIVMDQLSAKEFLRTTDPAGYYKLFMTGTGLRRLQDTLKKANMDLDDEKVMLVSEATALPKLEKELDEMKQQVQAIESCRSHRTQLKKLRHKLAWAQVEEAEKMVNDLTSKLNLQLTRAEACKPAIEELQKNISEREDAHEQTKVTAKALKEESKKFAQAIKDARAKVKSVESTLKQLKEKVTEEKKTIKRKKTEVAQVTKKIADIHKEAAGDEERQRMEEINQLTDEIAAERKKEAEESDKLDKLIVERDEAFENFLATKNAADTFDKNILSIKQQIRSVESRSNNKLLKFGGKQAETLHNMCKKARGFQQRPIGPIGYYINLKDTQWATAVQAQLKNTINAWIVHSSSDKKTLQDLARQAGCRGLQVIIQPYTAALYNMSPSKLPARNLTTIFDVIECQEHMVLNALIDQHNIENIALFNNTESAQQAIFRQKARNVKCGYTPDASQFSHRDGIDQFYTADARAPPVVLGVDSNMTKDKLEQQLKNAEAHARQKKEQMKSAAIIKTELQTEVQKRKDILKKTHKAIAMLDKKLEILQNEDDDVEEDVEEYEEHKRSLEESIDKCQRKIDKLLERYKDTEAGLGALKEEERAREEERAAAKKRADELMESCQTATEEQNAFQRQLEILQRKQQKLEMKTDQIRKMLREAKQDLEEKIPIAECICERVPVSQSVDKLLKEMATIERRINKDKATAGDFDAVRRKHQKLQSEVKSQKKNHRKANNRHERLDRMFKERHTHWKNFRKSTCHYVKHSFGTCLALRNSSGKLKFDHEKEELELQVTLRHKEKDAAQRGALQLSGGERSFTTVALILALWDRTDAPFCAQDEFDVCMDDTHRALAVSLLVKVAKRTLSRQAIFMMPTSSRFIPQNDPDVKVFKMPSVDRNQATLNFGQ